MFDVYVQDQFLKTPQGNPIEVPTLALAKAIEEEWSKDASPHYRQKPMTSLVATALDRVADDQESYVNEAIQAIPKDVLLFWAAMPESLARLQEEKWLPHIEEINKVFELSLKPTTTFSLLKLSGEEEERIKSFLYHQTIFKLAGFVHLITLTHSFCLSFLLIQGKLSADEVWELAHLHEQAQRRIWGEDEETLIREDDSRKEFLETVRFIELVGGLS